MPFRSSVEMPRPLTDSPHNNDCNDRTKPLEVAAVAGLRTSPWWRWLTPACVLCAGHAFSIILAPTSQTGAPGSTLPDPLTVSYLDSAGSPITGGSVYEVTSGNAACWTAFPGAPSGS